LQPRKGKKKKGGKKRRMEFLRQFLVWVGAGKKKTFSSDPCFPLGEGGEHEKRRRGGGPPSSSPNIFQKRENGRGREKNHKDHFFRLQRRREWTKRGSGGREEKKGEGEGPPIFSLTFGKGGKSRRYISHLSWINYK